MESRRYWRSFVERFESWEDKRLADRKWIMSGPACSGAGSGRVANSGKLISLEVYLSVPTFLRRGIRLAL